MAATNNSLSLAETATVPAPQQALSSTFEENVLTRSSSDELLPLSDQDAQVSFGPTPLGLPPHRACKPNPTPAYQTQLAIRDPSPMRVDHSCVRQRAHMHALPTAPRLSQCFSLGVAGPLDVT